MNELRAFSNQLADVIAGAAPSVVQVQGRKRPASGVVFADGLVLTTTRALGRDDGIQIRTDDGRALQAELAGWDPTTSLAVLRAADLRVPALAASEQPVRVGHLGVAVARSWSNAVTATAGLVSVIGGPLPTGRGRAIDRVIRTTAPMHSGFAGGAFIDVDGRLIGIATATEIRGLGVVIPADIALKSAQSLAEHGTSKRGFLGLAAQTVTVPDRNREGSDATDALLVVHVTSGSPADTGGILVGDILMTFDGLPLRSPVDLLELLHGDRVGRAAVLRILRAGAPQEVSVIVGERPAS